MESNGQLHLQTLDHSACLAIENFNGPGVVWWGCNTGSNEEFTLTGSALCSKGGYCLTAKATKPSGGGGGGGGGGDALQIWAKPQPKGATAVLVLNNNLATNTTVPFNFADVGYAHAGATTLLNIWSGKTVTLAAGTTQFSTDSFGQHDCRFYLLTPQ